MSSIVTWLEIKDKFDIKYTSNGVISIWFYSLGHRKNNSKALAVLLIRGTEQKIFARRKMLWECVNFSWDMCTRAQRWVCKKQWETWALTTKGLQFNLLKWVHCLLSKKNIWSNNMRWCAKYGLSWKVSGGRAEATFENAGVGHRGILCPPLYQLLQWGSTTIIIWRTRVNVLIS